MAENEPPPNGTNAAIVMVEGHPITRHPLANLNGNRSHGIGPKPAKIKKIDAKLDLEQPKIKSALEDLVDLETNNLCQTTRCRAALIPSFRSQLAHMESQKGLG
jgi:hypothetical protein